MHTPYIGNFFDLKVCPRCDFTVTQTDRLLKRVIDSGGDDFSLLSLQEHMQYVYEHWRSAR